MKKKGTRYKALLKYFVWALTALGIERWCFRETAGFRESKILSTLEYENRWEIKQLAEEKKQFIHSILDQPFFYIGHGGTSYCFVSQDDKYVIKFFKHQHLQESSLLSRITFPSFIESHRVSYLEQKQAQHKHKRKEFLFTSFLLAEEKIPDQTGIIHLQLNKSPDFKKDLILYDKIGVKHTIPLDQTEFVLQKKASLLIPLLNQLLEQDKIEEAKRVIDSFFANLQARCNQGLHDRDPHPSINFGYVDGHVVEVDIGSFSIDESLKDPINQKKAIVPIAASVSKKLRSGNFREITVYIDEKLESLYPQ